MSTEVKFPLFDCCERNHGGAWNSIQANKFVAPKKRALQEQIHAYITSRGRFGATLHEVARDLGIKIQTASARMSEAKQSDGPLRIFWNGQKRAQPDSQPANVYVTSEGQLK